MLLDNRFPRDEGAIHRALRLTYSSRIYLARPGGRNVPSRRSRFYEIRATEGLSSLHFRFHGERNTIDVDSFWQAFADETRSEEKSNERVCILREAEGGRLLIASRSIEIFRGIQPEWPN